MISPRPQTFSKKYLRLRSSSPNILSCAKAATHERNGCINGMSSNGRTADSGSVNGGSTPSIPAIRPLHMARSSSGLGRRPLKAEITSSNLVRATKNFKGSSEPFFIPRPAPNYLVDSYDDCRGPFGFLQGQEKEPYNRRVRVLVRDARGCLSEETHVGFF